MVVKELFIVLCVDDQTDDTVRGLVYSRLNDSWPDQVMIIEPVDVLIKGYLSEDIPDVVVLVADHWALLFDMRVKMWAARLNSTPYVCGVCFGDIPGALVRMGDFNVFPGGEFCSALINNISAKCGGVK